MNHFVPIVHVQTSSGFGGYHDSEPESFITKKRRKSTPQIKASQKIYSGKSIHINKLASETDSYRSEDRHTNDVTPRKKKNSIKNVENENAVKEWRISMPVLEACWFDGRSGIVHTVVPQPQLETGARLSLPHEDDVEVQAREKRELLSMPLLQEKFYTLSENIQIHTNSHHERSESKEKDVKPKKKLKHDVYKQISRNEDDKVVNLWQPSMPLLEERWFIKSNENVEMSNELLTMPLLPETFYICLN